jgi:hypothetical protein
MDHYGRALWLVSFALVFDYNKYDFEKLLELLGNEGCDAFFERLVAFRFSGRIKTDILLHPNPYNLLYSAIDTSPQEQQKLIKNFLDKYYSGLKDAYWYSYENLGNAYFGYWCFELAAIVQQLGIQDKTFITTRYYPYHLAHYHRT